MGQPNDPRIVTARNIVAEADRLHIAGAHRADLVYYFGRIQTAAHMLLEYIDEPVRPPRVPDTAHTFASTDGETYTCSKCGRVADSDSVWRLSVLEECGGEQQ